MDKLILASTTYANGEKIIKLTCGTSSQVALMTFRAFTTASLAFLLQRGRDIAYPGLGKDRSQSREHAGEAPGNHPGNQRWRIAHWALAPIRAPTMQWNSLCRRGCRALPCSRVTTPWMGVPGSRFRQYYRYCSPENVKPHNDPASDLYWWTQVGPDFYYCHVFCQN